MLILDQSKSNIVNVERTINIGIEEESTLTDIVKISALFWEDMKMKKEPRK